MVIDESQILGVGFVDETLALACLPADGICFLNHAKFGNDTTTCIFVNCSDVFAWGCADAECITNNDYEEPSEIIDLYRLWSKDNVYGPVKWVCLKRNEQPQKPLKDRMIKKDSWDDELEALPANHYDAKCREYAEKQKNK